MSNQEQRTRATFAQHGIALRPAAGTQFVGDSPFAPPGKGTGKFYVHRLSGLWDCKVSGKSGNLRGFFAEKSKINEANFRGAAAQRLAEDRALPFAALRAWRVGWDGRQYTIPAGACDKVYDLRCYQIGGKTQSTAGANVSLAGVAPPSAEEVFLCEGEWDGIACYAMLSEAPAATVYAAPGAGTFPAHAVPFFAGKKVRVLYDNDEAGRAGSARVQRMLAGVAQEILYLQWPEGLPDGYDVRDFYKAGKTLENLRALLGPACPGGTPADAPKPIEEELAKLCGPGLPPETVLRRYRAYLYLPNPEVLDVLFGVAFANRLGGDPVWLFMVAPPGGTKTELLMSIADSPLVRTISSLTPRTLVSGAQNNRGGPDPSLLPHLNGRVLVVKDFTTILSMPQLARDEIFGTLREVYDGRFEKSWGTGVSRRYDVRFGMLAGVTPVIEKFSASSSVLGERFIKYRIPRTDRLAADDSLIDAALANLNRDSEMRTELQRTAAEVLNRPADPANPPGFPDSMRIRFRKLAQWVASLRGVVSRERYTGQVEFRPTAEVGTRLAKQFAKLAQGIAIYHQRPDIGEGIYRTIVNVARSTVPDRIEETVRQMYVKENEDIARANGASNPGTGAGYTATDIGKWARLDPITSRAVIDDMLLLRIVQCDPAPRGPRGKSTYRLSKAMRALMDSLNLYPKERMWAHARTQAKGSPEPTRRRPRRAYRVLGANAP